MATGVVAETWVKEAIVCAEGGCGLEVVLYSFCADLAAAKVGARGNVKGIGRQEAFSVEDWEGFQRRVFDSQPGAVRAKEVSLVEKSVSIAGFDGTLVDPLDRQAFISDKSIGGTR